MSFWGGDIMAVKEKRDYDLNRYRETSKKLKEGFRKLKKKKGNNDNITIYELSKFTDFTRKTIYYHEEILDIINKQKEVDVSFTSVEAKKISSLDEAKLIIEELNEINENKTQELKKLMRKNTSLNRKIVKLKKENKNIKKENNLIKDKLR